MRLVAITAFFWFALDQLSKYGVLYGLNLVEIGRMEGIPPLLNFHLGYNTGINFGLFGGGPEVMRWILIGIAIVICSWLLWWAKTGLTRRLALVAAGSVIGGALGNTLDRLTQGAVIDFLNMSCCGIQNPFAFNIADVGIVLGALGLLIFADPPKDKA